MAILGKRFSAITSLTTDAWLARLTPGSDEGRPQLTQGLPYMS
jgi:hypothetical protein